MSICKELDEAVQKYLRTATFPVAVKILENAEQFPERTRRPLRDMGHRLNLCRMKQTRYPSSFSHHKSALLL